MTFRALGRTFELELEPNTEIFAPGARNVWIGDAGVSEDAPSVALYRGHVRGEPGSWVRVSLLGGAMDGMIRTPAEIYFVEPRARHVAGAAAGETIAYRLSDTTGDWAAGSCPVQHPPRGVGPVDHAARAGSLASAVAGLAVPAGATLAQVTLGIVADYAYYTRHGSDAAAAAAAMQSIINQVDGIYRNEVGTTFTVTQTVVHTTQQSDPFGGSCFVTDTAGRVTTDYLCLLSQFSSYKDTPANAVYGTDLAHLFTGRSLTGSVVGVSWLGSLCSSYYGTGLSQDFTTDNKSLVLLTAHEIGHNFAAPHDNAPNENPPSPCASAPFGAIMNPYVDTALDLQFSVCSKSLINSEIANASCLITVPNVSPTPTATPTPTPTPTPLGPTATPTATPRGDAVVYVPWPVTVTIKPGQTSVNTAVGVAVSSADATGMQTVRLRAADGDCPPGTVAGLPDFDRSLPGPQDSTLLASSGRFRSRAAVLPLTITSAAFNQGFSRLPAQRCRLQVTVETVGAPDPHPSNNTAEIELNVINQNQPPPTAVHESFVLSTRAVTIVVKKGQASVMKYVAVVVGNADVGEAGHSISVTAADGDCPAGTVGTADFDRFTAGAQNSAFVPGGRVKAAALPLTINAAAFASPNLRSPDRCTALLTISGPPGDVEATSNTTKLPINVIDLNDF